MRAGETLVLHFDLVELVLVEQDLRKALEHLRRVSSCLIQLVSPVNHVLGILSSRRSVLAEQLPIVDVSHLSRQHANGELAVAVDVLQGGLAFPVLCFRLHDRLEVRHLAF